MRSARWRALRGASAREVRARRAEVVGVPDHREMACVGC